MYKNTEFNAKIFACINSNKMAATILNILPLLLLPRQESRVAFFNEDTFLFLKIRRYKYTEKYYI
jgi:hypothetical protein